MRIDWWELQWVFLGFVVFTIIGTVSHEMGHYAMAKFFGRSASLHYGYCDYGSSKLDNRLQALYIEKQRAKENGRNFQKVEEFEALKSQQRRQAILMTLGGPLQTILTGTIGLVFLIFRKSRIRKLGMEKLDWLLVFLSLFWLREPTNLFTGSVAKYIFNKELRHGDEIRLARYWELSQMSVITVLGLIGLAVALYVIFVILPKQKRLTFILGGLLGGVFGFWFWLYLFGPVVMP